MPDAFTDGFGGGGSGGASWVLVHHTAFGELAATDLSSGGSVGGWTAENTGNVGTFETDGTDSLDIQPNKNTSVASDTSPGVYDDLDDLVSGISNDDELFIVVRFTVPAASGAGNGRVYVCLRNSSTVLTGGVWCQVTPSQWEVDAMLANTSSYTDSGTALGGESNRVMMFIARPGVLLSCGEQAYSGSPPTSPPDVSMSIGETTGSGKTSNAIDFEDASTQFKIAAHRNINTYTTNIHDVWIYKRSAA